MAEEFTKEVDEALAAWTVLDTLPKELDGFTLSKMRQEHEGQYDFFRYDAPAEHRAIVGFYDDGTKTYKVRVAVGVVSFALLCQWGFGDVRAGAHTESAACDGGAACGGVGDAGACSRV